MQGIIYMLRCGSVKKVLKEKADIEICEEKFYTENKDVQSLGIACVVNFFGRIKGKFLIDMKRDLAFALAKNIKGEDFDPEDEPMVLKPFQTLSKIIVNKAIEELNNLYSAKIEAAPPIVLKGKTLLSLFRRLNLCLLIVPPLSANLESMLP